MTLHLQSEPGCYKKAQFSAEFSACLRALQSLPLPTSQADQMWQSKEFQRASQDVSQDFLKGKTNAERQLAYPTSHLPCNVPAQATYVLGCSHGLSMKLNRTGHSVSLITGRGSLGWVPESSVMPKSSLADKVGW